MTTLIPFVAGVLRLPVDEVGDDTGAATTAAWTSLRHLEIVLGVEREYGLRLTPREARTCRSVAALRSLLREKGITA